MESQYSFRSMGVSNLIGSCFCFVPVPSGRDHIRLSNFLQGDEIWIVLIEGVFIDDCFAANLNFICGKLVKISFLVLESLAMPVELVCFYITHIGLVDLVFDACLVEESGKPLCMGYFGCRYQLSSTVISEYIRNGHSLIMFGFVFEGVVMQILDLLGILAGCRKQKFGKDAIPVLVGPYLVSSTALDFLARCGLVDMALQVASFRWMGENMVVLSSAIPSLERMLSTVKDRRCGSFPMVSTAIRFTQFDLESEDDFLLLLLKDCGIATFACVPLSIALRLIQNYKSCQLRGKRVVGFLSRLCVFVPKAELGPRTYS
ncbi:hypothetical protein HAX54_001675 [Datura stramonium]|uniref:Uncharacterized protein n=1 Tax=Datura stramonium TaxID=4076 RepID=A0ABS8WT96_DATST|nr:hypothetical protein [Datura stramonium]